MTRKLLPPPRRAKNEAQYRGEYVAVLDDGTVVAHDPDYAEVRRVVVDLGLERDALQYFVEPPGLPIAISPGAFIEILPVPPG